MSKVLAAQQEAKEPKVSSTSKDIATCADAKLHSDAFQGENIKAKVGSSGAVVLTGVVSDTGQKGAAAKIARKCGATKVTNKILVVETKGGRHKR